jgi:hypothetical protein
MCALQGMVSSFVFKRSEVTRPRGQKQNKGNAISGKDGRYLYSYCCRSRRTRLHFKIHFKTHLILHSLLQMKSNKLEREGGILLTGSIQYPPNY